MSNAIPSSGAYSEGSIRVSDVEKVATWAGLITGIAGSVLSVVVIWFALATEARSRAVSDQMIKSLQKIESAVDRTADDTQGLIKVAWDRLIPGAGVGAADPGPLDPSSSEQIASGI